MRRTHLYSGLALVPFVVLYGITGFLFNHPTAWSESDVRTIPAATLAAHGRQEIAPPIELATGVLAELDDSGWQLDDAVEPSYRGRSLLTANTNDKRVSFVIDEVNGDARVFERPSTIRPKRTDRTVGKGLEAGQDALTTITASALALLAAGRPARANADAAGNQDSAPTSPIQWRVRSQPRLHFGVIDADGEAHRAVYDLRTRELEVTPETEPRQTRSLRSFLLRLHTAHGYPAHHGAAFWWALIVDVMAIAMTTWAISGLLMWWQMKNLRWLGLLALTACAVGTTWLVAAQWQLLR
ncbi:MAG: PepSY domain-containing protein [bacterium]|nr:PepSY domain-containing protein [bacterium]